MMSGFDAAALTQDVLDQGQPAANAAQLPGGMRLLALARWGQTDQFGPDEPPPVPLEVALAAVGGPSAEAVGFGHLKLTSIEVGDGTPLKWLGAISSDSGLESPVHDFVRIDRDGVFSIHPEGGLLSGYQFSRPLGTVDAIRVLEGELTLQVAANRKEITLPNVHQLAGAPLTDPDLSSAGVTLRIDQIGGGETLQVMSPVGSNLGKIELVDAVGHPLPNTSWTNFSDGVQETHGLASVEGSLPADVGLRVTLFQGIQETPVAFRFENLPVPPNEELSDSQRAMVTWTPVEPSDKLPEGLVVEAQVRWDSEASGMLGMAPSFGGSSSFDTQSEYNGDSGEYNGGEPEGGSGRPRPGAGGSFGQPGEGLGGADGPRLQVVVDLLGPVAEAAEAIGDLRAAAVKTGEDINLELVAVGHEMFADQEGFQSIDRADVFAQHPPDGVRTTFQFAAPKLPTREIATFTGSLKLRTIREKPELLITGIEERAGHPITQGALAKYGLQIVAGVEGNNLMVRVLKGDPERILPDRSDRQSEHRDHRCPEYDRSHTHRGQVPGVPVCRGNSSEAGTQTRDERRGEGCRSPAALPQPAGSAAARCLIRECRPDPNTLREQVRLTCS